VSGVLAVVGVLAAAGAAVAAILLAPGRGRSVAMLLALVLFPILILGDQWHSTQIVDLRDDSARLTGLILAGLAAVVILALAFRRWPVLLPLAVVGALPFRVPLHAGGDTANLLVPLYLVIAAGVLSTALREWGGGGVPLAQRRPVFRTAGLARGTDSKAKNPASEGDTPTSPYLLPYVLAGVVALYALQTLYSPDFSKSLQNVCFFFVPFSLVYALLRDVHWDRKLLVLVLWVMAVEAVAFVLVGSIEYASRSLFWNDQVIRSNEFHTYFRVNSIFWDPNIYGRYLALAIVIAMSTLLWTREHRTLGLLTGLVAVLWLGLVLTFSQSSFAALLAGLAVLAALRWSWRWTLVAVGAGAVLAVVIVLFAGGVSKLSPDRINSDTGGRGNLVSGGAKLFEQRPLWGYGAGSFPRAYREHAATKKVPVSVSHTEPVTVAAEQGLIGLFAYGTLIVVAVWTMGGGLFAGTDTPALPLAQRVGRIAVLAAFVALLVHTMAYAGFYEDPITWVLLAVGASLAAAPAVRPAA
jgi:putative inorganic carbon (hco3(-)) transporter